MVLIHCYIEKPPGIRPSLPAARAARCVGHAPPTRPPAGKKTMRNPGFSQFVQHGAPKIAFSCLISGGILWFVVDIMN